MAILEHLNDGDGSLIVGWLAPNVLYSRLTGVIAEGLATRLARRLTLLIGDTLDIDYFTDTSAISSFDLKAFAAVVDAMTAKREHFHGILAYTGHTRRSANARALPDAFSNFEYALTLEEFELRLRSAAPAADLTTLVSMSTRSALERRASFLPFVDGRPSPSVRFEPPELPHIVAWQYAAWQPSLARLADPYGSVSVGWLGHRVLYARFEGTISVELGVSFAQLFAWLVGASTGVHYFSDSSRTSGCDELARRVVCDALLAKKAVIERIVARPWALPLHHDARTFADSMGCLDFVFSADELDARVRAATARIWREALTAVRVSQTNNVGWAP
jgi:hypothetical protein